MAKRQTGEGPQASSKKRKARGARRPHLLVKRRDSGEAAALDTSARGGVEVGSDLPRTPQPRRLGSPACSPLPAELASQLWPAGPAEVRPRLERAPRE